MVVVSRLLEKSTHFSVYQHADKRNFVIDFGARSVTLTFCELLHLRRQLFSLMEHDVLTNNIESGRSEIISLCHHEYFFMLLPLEIIELNELIHQIFRR